MAKLVSINPSTLEVVGETPVSSAKDVKQKVELSRQAFPAWRALAISDRVKYIKELAKKLKEFKKEFAETAASEMGMPISDALFDVDDGLHFISEYCKSAKEHLAPKVLKKEAKEIHTEYREPWGVVAAILPWNFPFSNFVWGSVQALLAGNTVVMKHSELVPLSSQFVEKASEVLPKGVLNVVYGDGKVGDLLTDQDIDMISFTGSTATGIYLYEKAARKFIPIGLELGGSSPGIVFKDADIEASVSNITENRLLNSGQVCDGLKRLIVHKSVFEKVIGALAENFSQKKIGNALDSETQLGPLASEAQYNRAVDQLNDAVRKGGKVVLGGPDYDRDGFFFKPTLVTNIKPNMRIWQEEVFAPILPVVSFSDEAEAIALANDSVYGLGSYVYSENKTTIDKVAAQIQAGMVSVNGRSYISPHNPFGGYKLSGLGREHGRYGFEHFTQIKVVAN